MTVKLKKPAANAADAAFAAALTRAKEARSKLEKATDKLNTLITAAEKAIAALKLGVTGQVLIEEREDTDFERYLLFIKINDQWRLATAYSHVLAVDPSLDDITPLVNAPRSIRLTAVQFFQHLLEQMLGAVDKELELVEARAGIAEGFVKSLSEAMAQPDPFEDLAGPPPSDDIPF